MQRESKRISVVDSHTGGEPTRLVIGGFPDLGNGTMAERLNIFRSSFDNLRTAIIKEPRGYDAIVGALLCEPFNSDCAAGVIFFNNAGYLGMCGHGTIGLVKTLEYLGKLSVGVHRIDTPVGIVSAELKDSGEVQIENVPSFRYRKDVNINVSGYGQVTGDIAWGGNWFFLIEDHDLELSLQNIPELTDFTTAVRTALIEEKVTGESSAEIDHIELFSAAEKADSRNFVLCPGREYDRSPCGTGTSAKLACLYSDGKLKEGDKWIQESIIGSVFEGSVKLKGDRIVPMISGTAFVTAESQLVIETDDPFRFGIV